MDDELLKSYEEADKRFEAALAKLKMGGKVPKLNRYERDLLEFCAGRDMKEYLREEFERHPIRLDENGNLIGKNPFDEEREKKENTVPYIYEI